MPLPDGRGVLGAMPAWIGKPATLGIKVITVFPGNEGSRLDSHQGAVLLFDTADGPPTDVIRLQDDFGREGTNAP